MISKKTLNETFTSDSRLSAEYDEVRTMGLQIWVPF